MADYWKSNDKKFCEFCKCWIADNKPSISFHENGKRHKANAKAKISDISRNSAQADKEKAKMEQQIQKMEEAAMRSYTQDVHRKGDLTARSISAVIALTKTKQVDPLLPANLIDFNEGPNVQQTAQPQPEIPESSMWVEGKSDEGHTYYWNVRTNESVWEPPKEGFMTLQEYNRINELAIQQQEVALAQESKHFQKNADEMVAKYRREQMKTLIRPKIEEKKEIEEKRSLFKTEADKDGAAPIGQWQAVENKHETQVDLELPNADRKYHHTVSFNHSETEPPVKKFKEKTISTLDSETAALVSSTFKKRKTNAKKNARQRLDVD